jgi:putative ABC transport system permease protein
LPPTKYADAEARRRFHEQLLRDAAARPGVVQAALTNVVPSTGDNESRTVEIEGRPASEPGGRPAVDYRAVSDELFATLRQTLVRGRGFDSRDRHDAAPVAIVSERMARQLWPGEDPMGRRFRVAAPDEPWRQVIGVARDVRHDWFMNRVESTFYVPIAQAAPADVTLVLRTSGEPDALAAEGRRAVLAVDPDQPVYEVRTLGQIRWDKALGLRYAAGFMTCLGLVGLLLAAVGIFGVMAYAVGTRTQEIGIRVALGASRSAVLASTVGRALAYATVGLGVGFLGAYALGKTMEQVLFGGVQLDVASFVVFPLLLAAIALLASVVPARRALRVDPAVTLRGE